MDPLYLNEYFSGRKKSLNIKFNPENIKSKLQHKHILSFQNMIIILFTILIHWKGENFFILRVDYQELFKGICWIQFSFLVVNLKSLKELGNDGYFSCCFFTSLHLTKSSLLHFVLGWKSKGRDKKWVLTITLLFNFVKIISHWNYMRENKEC